MPASVGPSPSVGGSDAVMTGIPLVVGVLVAVALIVFLGDLLWRRRAMAARLERRISDALRRDARLSGLVVTPTVLVPLFRQSPVTVGLSGEVPRPELRTAVFEIVAREAYRIQRGARIEDRIAVEPSDTDRMTLRRMSSR